MENNNPNYYAIIPASVRYDKDLTANAKLLYGEITALCNSKGYCWATNEYFAELYDVAQETISRWVSSLVNGGHLTSSIKYKNGTKEIESRILKIATPIDEKINTSPQKDQYPIDDFVNTPIDEKIKENNTSIEHYKINSKNEYKKGASASLPKDEGLKKEEPATMPDGTESRCQKSKKKKTEFEISCFNDCKDVWFVHNPHWQFSGKDGTGIYSLIDKLKKSMEQGGAEITKETIASTFEFLITNLPDNEFYKTADPGVLASKYNSIFKSYKSLQNGTNGNSISKGKQSVYATSKYS